MRHGAGVKRGNGWVLAGGLTLGVWTQAGCDQGAREGERSGEDHGIGESSTSSDVVAPEEQASPVDDPVAWIDVGAIGRCELTVAGAVRCAHRPPQSVGPPVTFELARAGARELAVAGTVVWHEELVACALLGRVGEGATTEGGTTEGGTAILCNNRGPFTVDGAHGLTLGDNVGCVRDATDRAVCWRAIFWPDEPEPAPEQPVAPFADARAVSLLGLAATASRACALSDDGRVRCWNPGADPGSGTTIAVDTAVGRAVQISASAWHVCVLRSDRSVGCWNDDGAPAPVYESPEPVARLAAGGFDVCTQAPGATDVVCRDGSGDARIWASGALDALEVGVAGVCGRRGPNDWICAPPGAFDPSWARE